MSRQLPPTASIAEQLQDGRLMAPSAQIRVVEERMTLAPRLGTPRTLRFPNFVVRIRENSTFFANDLPTQSTKTE